jgi:hypothetical protein
MIARIIQRLLEASGESRPCKHVLPCNYSVNCVAKFLFFSTTEQYQAQLCFATLGSLGQRERIACKTGLIVESW